MKSNITTEYQQYLLSDEWKEFRKKAFAHYGRKCDRCQKTTTLQIHHLHYNNIFHEELEDVRVLCKAHHEKVHGIKHPKKKLKLTKSQRKKARKREKKLDHLNGKNIKLRGSHKPHFNKEVKGNHALKLQHPILDKIAELKRLREIK